MKIVLFYNYTLPETGNYKLIKGSTMKKTVVFVILVAALVSVPFTSFAQSDVKHFQISVFDPVQIHDSSTSIHGVRISLFYGVNQDVHGLDWGLVHKVNGDMIGLQSGVVNLVEGDVMGYQDGIVNHVRGDFYGWQSGFVNISKSKFVGYQSGWINYANDMSGVQFGLVNIADSLYGLQIGLVNINKSGDPHYFLPIVNFSF